MVFLDLETTGPNPGVDRIVEIALIKVHPDGHRESLTRRVHPGMPIPPESTRIHGITDADVAEAPRLSGIADEILRFVGDADLAGFNIQRFDLPVLLRELTMAGRRMDLTDRAVVDAQVIFHRMEPRHLAAAYRYYCGKELRDPHTAAADVEACLEVLDAQLAAYPDLPRTPKEIYARFTVRDNAAVDPAAAVDPSGRFVWEGDEVVFTFGPEGIKGRPLREVAVRDRGFLQWILRKDFSPEVKAITQDALEGKFPRRVP
jgi:DNA polymerase-3 subunit epsilon